MLRFLLFLFLISYTSAQDQTTLQLDLTKQTDQPVSANLNEYIDNVLPAIVNFMINNGMDPMDIPDVTDGFSVKPLFITYHGELELTKGVLTNLRTLKRSGDTIVTYWNRILRLKADFGVEDIRFDYKYLAKVMNIGPTGGVKGKVTKMSFMAEILLDFNNFEIQLQDFYVHDVGKITVKLTGNILTDFLSNAIIDVITTLFKGVILRAVESNLRNAIQEQIDQINQSINPKTIRKDENGLILTANLNNFIDNSFPEFTASMGANGLDPMMIQDINQGFDVKPLQFFEYRGEVLLKHGLLTNLKTLKRTGNTMLKYSAETLHAKGDFGAENLQIYYDYEADVVGLKQKGSIIGKIESIKFTMELSANFTAMQIHLDDFYVYDVGDLTISMMENEAIDNISNGIINSASVVFKNVILKMIEDNVKDAATEQIRILNKSILLIE